MPETSRKICKDHFLFSSSGDQLKKIFKDLFRLKKFFEDFFWRTLPPVSLASRGCVLGFGLGIFLCPWPWPQALRPWLHLWLLLLSLLDLYPVNCRKRKVNYATLVCGTVEGYSVLVLVYCSDQYCNWRLVNIATCLPVAWLTFCSPVKKHYKNLSISNWFQLTLAVESKFKFYLILIWLLAF